MENYVRKEITDIFLRFTFLGWKQLLLEHLSLLQSQQFIQLLNVVQILSANVKTKGNL